MVYKPHSLKICRLDYADSEFDLPTCDSALDDEEFERACRVIVEEFIGRRAASAGRRRDGARAWLLEITYELVAAILDADDRLLLIERSVRFDRYPLGVPDSGNPFQLGLMAIFAHNPKAVRPQDREYLGKRQWHAYRHYIPPVLIQGFIGQIESKCLEQRASDNYIEDKFERWIVACQVEGHLTGERGAYPESIVRQVIALTPQYKKDLAELFEVYG